MCPPRDVENAASVSILSLPFLGGQPAPVKRGAERGLALPLIESALPRRSLDTATVAAALHRLADGRDTMLARLHEARLGTHHRPNAPALVQEIIPGIFLFNAWNID
jgi:hypothetical protein